MEDLQGRSVKGYQLGERIGAGGFGVVYRGYQSTVGREVAIKIILPGFTNHPDFIRRFEAEAQVIARLEHLHIAPLYDFWREPQGAYLVMRYLRGGNLADALRKGPFDLESAALLLDQICAALAHAHNHGIVHRDIKPANILLDEDGNAYLADFGIAKDVQVAEPGLTDADSIVGSPDYISPEQARKENISPQADIYSLGIVLYEMLTGEHPFPDLPPVARLFKHLNDPVPRIDSLDSDVAESVNEVIQQATAKDPRGRFATVGSFAAAFRDAAGLSVSQVTRSLVELLTPREQQVLKLMIDGKTNREIADKLVIEVTTVKWYTRQIYRKLNVRSRVQAIVKARELNLIIDEVESEGAVTSAFLPLSEPENPYRGLRPFRVADERYFFGREHLIKEILDRIAEDVDYSRFLAIVGPSGSGKSSLVKAGLIPALWRGELSGSEGWFVVEMVPGAHPLDELEVGLMQIAVEQSGSVMEQLRRDERGLARVAKLILPDDDSELLIVIDQFEEIFTLVEDEHERFHTLELIRNATTDPRSRVRIVITLRADFYDRPLQNPEFGALVQQRTQTVLPLTAGELERAIIQPAKAVQVKFEEGLAAAIAQDVNYQPGALPLMQYALTELFEHREDHTLTHAAYEAIGGSVGALAKRIENIYAELDPAGQDTVRQMFLRLVTLGEGAEDTRRRVPRSELLAISSDPDLMDELIDTYTASRLLSLDHDPATRSPTVELAHEAILREWDRLKGWLDESREDIRMQRGLSRAAVEWRQAEDDDSFLLRGLRLAQYAQWIEHTDLELTTKERNYLEASLERREQEAEEEAVRRAREEDLEKRRLTLSRTLTIVLAIGMIVAVSLSVFALSQRQGALKQTAVLLAAQAETEVESGYYDRAVLLGLEALENYPYTPQAEHALGQAVTYNRALQQFVGHSAAMTSVDWSPDGTKIASSSTDNSVRIWDASTGQTLQIIELPRGITGNVSDWALSVKWSPDGKQLLTVTGDRFVLGSQDYDLILLDAETGQQIRMVEVVNQTDPAEGRGTQVSGTHYAISTAVSFARRSGRIATVGGDNTAIIWDASLEKQMTVLEGHERGLNSVAWSTDESRLATASEDGTARIWNVASGEQEMALLGHDGAVNAVAWSPDDMRVATAGKDGTVRLWDTETGVALSRYSPDAGVIWSIAWSQDGKYIATGTDDATVRLWDVETGEEFTKMKGHQGFITQVAWSPIDERLASASTDITARVWNAAPTTAKLTFPTGYVMELAWSPDSRYLAVGTGDSGAGTEPGSLSVWDVVSKKIVIDELDSNLDPRWVWFAREFSPDGRYVSAVGSLPWPDVVPSQSTVHVFDSTTGREVRSFTVTDGGFARTSSWSPDGTKMAVGTGLGEGTLYVWDFHTGDLLNKVNCGEWINYLAWSPDGNKIAVLCLQFRGAEQTGWVEVRDGISGKTLMTLTDPDPSAFFYSVNWSPDGTKLLTAGGNDIVGSKINPVMIFDATTGGRLLTINQHAGQVWRAEWSPNGERIVTGSTDDTTRIWDVETGAELLTISTPNNWQADPSWSPDGKYVAIELNSPESPTDSGVWRVWQTTEELIEYARECCVIRALTAEERARFGLPPSQDTSDRTETIQPWDANHPTNLLAFGVLAFGLAGTFFGITHFAKP